MDIFTTLSICTGIGMLDHGVNIALGGKLNPILYVEREAFACANLAWQIEKNFLAPAPIWNDVKTITDIELGHVDILIGGIPCQPWSVAGKQAGSGDDRDLWPATVRAIEKFEPGLVFIENVAGIISKEQGGWRIKTDLEAMGYRVEAGVFSSEEVGASHRRERVFILGFMEDSARIGRGRGRDGDTERCERSFETERRCRELDNSPRIFNSGEERKEIRGRGGDGETGSELADSNGAEGNGPVQEKSRFGRGRSSNGNRELGNCEDIGRCGGFGRESEIKPQSRDTELDNTFIKGLERYKRDVDKEAGEGTQNRSIAPASSSLPRYALGRNDWMAWTITNRVDSTRMPSIERELCGVVDGVSSRVDRLRGIGNGVDPMVAGYAFLSLYACVRSGGGEIG